MVEIFFTFCCVAVLLFFTCKLSQEEVKAYNRLIVYLKTREVGLEQQLKDLKETDEMVLSSLIRLHQSVHEIRVEIEAETKAAKFKKSLLKNIRKQINELSQP
jgi:hypothetical protein